MSDWKAKLHPARFPGMSPKMAAVVGYVCDEQYTDPSFDDAVITSDGFVLAQRTGDVGLNEFIGHVSDLLKNWLNLLRAADDLTAEERALADAAFEGHFRDFRVEGMQ